MPLARAWWRGSAWALAATLVVPGALAIAVATIALGGGLRSLGAVAQIVTGPEVPEAQLNDRPAAARPDREGRVTPLPPVPATRGTAGGTRAFVAPGATGSSNASTSTSGPSTGTTAPATGPSASSPAPATSPSTGSSPSSPPAQSSPPPSQPADPVRQTGDAVAGTVKKTVPAPVGPAAGDAVSTVLDLVDPQRAATVPAP